MKKYRGKRIGIASPVKSIRSYDIFDRKYKLAR
jgi:hypothetical protein